MRVGFASTEGAGADCGRQMRVQNGGGSRTTVGRANAHGQCRREQDNGGPRKCAWTMPEGAGALMPLKRSRETRRL
jgi:hypothetical protein